MVLVELFQKLISCPSRGKKKFFGKRSFLIRFPLGVVGLAMRLPGFGLVAVRVEEDTIGAYLEGYNGVSDFENSGGGVSISS